MKVTLVNLLLVFIVAAGALGKYSKNIYIYYNCFNLLLESQNAELKFIC